MSTVESWPFVTVVMPVRNEAALIQPSLGAVLAQDYPADRIEVLVVDGESTDETLSIVQAIAAVDVRVRVLSNPGWIQARALNIGLDTARGEVIVRVDGHTIITPDYVWQCVSLLRTTGASNVGGPQRCVGVTAWGRAIAAAYRSPFGVPSRFRVSRRAAYVDTVYMGAWPREVFERVGRFDETLAVHEDYEHNYRIRRAGGRIYLSPDIRSEYYGRQTPGALGRQFFRYGGEKLQVLLRYPASARPRHLVAPAWVAAVVGGAILAPLHRHLARLWGVVLLGYAVANAVASVRTAARDGRDLLPRLPVVFACMHVSWGVGFWLEGFRCVIRAMAKRK
ncbi:MAG TPA: glycosyltransferase family 2 protein [Aggregatilineaceae bacterium]|nr:glycosyltransferase family 2 protein [Aggregatilineaceae bacterium]